MVEEKTASIEKSSDIGVLSPKDCKFRRNKNGFLALYNGSDEYKRVFLVRALPLTDPLRCISVFDAEDKEIGIIEDVNELYEESAILVKEELDSRYFCPEVTEIRSINDKMGYFYFDVAIKGFKKTFAVKDISKNIRQMDDGVIMLTDVDGNRFKIPDIRKISPKSRRLLEPYLY